MDLYERIIELSQQGYYCSQILMKLLLETLGEDNPELVKAMMGLCGGVGFSGGCCGCMTAGTCMISYLTGKGSDDEPESADHKPMMKVSDRQGKRANLYRLCLTLLRSRGMISARRPSASRGPCARCLANRTKSPVPAG